MEFKDRFYYGAKRFFLAFSFVGLFWVTGVFTRLYVVNSALVASMMTDALFIVLSIIIYITRGYHKRDKTRYHVPLSFKSFGLMFGVFLVVYAATQSISIWYLLNASDTRFSNYQVTANSLGTYVRIGFQVLVAPVAEEFIFRGVIYNSLKSPDKKSGYTMNWFTAVVCTSFMFGVMHGNMVQIIAGMLAGLWFCLLYELTGKLWVSILSHVAYNGISQISGIHNMLPYNSLIMSGVLIVIAIGLCIWMTFTLDTEHKYIAVD